MTGLVLDVQMLGKPKEKHWLTYIKQRIKKNKNFLGFISGQTGSGKSWSCLSMCEDLDKDFSIDRVVFSGLELMNLINSDKLKRGSAVVFEEIGVEMNNRNWQSVTNKMLHFLIQTFRHLGIVLIMNSPFMDFVDASTRKLFHAEFQTVGIDFVKEECRLKPQIIQYNGRLQKFYYKRLKVIRPEGVVPIDLWRVHKPSDELVRLYEAKKKAYTTVLNERIIDELQAVSGKRKGKVFKELTEVQAGVVELLKRGLTIPVIAQEQGKSEFAIGQSVRLARKKGYLIKAVYGDGGLQRYEVTEPSA